MLWGLAGLTPESGGGVGSSVRVKTHFRGIGRPSITGTDAHEDGKEVVKFLTWTPGKMFGRVRDWV